MEMGYDLASSLDAYDQTKTNVNEGLKSETFWGNPLITIQTISEYARLGFKTIRIPVTWHNHIIDENYTIDPKWMNRVKTVVDIAIQNKLYVILNMQYDEANYSVDPIGYGQGYYLLKKDLRESCRFIYNIWRQIVIAFNEGYDEHLIFQSFNQPKLKGMDEEWWCKENSKTCTEAVNVLDEYNDIIFKVIRNSGGNNRNRFVMFTPLGANIDN